ncbi:Glycosyltransferase involved in cell wall bisynthesis [Roseomonas rosea]|uniref:Glycosyltransferase involved in cell wall bisynthesis n=1 Tax=Muricoccus roseus TaxID=198092 RepID=A0A1M6NAG3_9PROT|nr:glycosyltransferase [Roseomonas rosea]SHJ92718.1 Glycosyltransferase involved in cell wall bisynthesis [Roseomonas rosea]
MNAPFIAVAAPPRQPLVLSVFPTFAVGGAQVRFAALANRQGARWRHAIVSLDGQFGCAERLAAGVPFERITFRTAPGEPLPLRLRRIRAVIRALRPDALVTSNWGSVEWAIANLGPARIRHLHTEDGFGPDEAEGQKRRRVIFRALTLRWSSIALPSSVLLRSAREQWRLPERRLHLVPNGLDLRRFRRDGPAAAIEVPGRGPLIGTVAALRREKNIGRLLQAVALLRRQGVAMRLAVIGEGPERQDLEELAASLEIQDRVRFTGHLRDPAAAYRALDGFALSSDTEQMPFSVLEAMASGLPVVSTDVGDVRLMLSAENRALVTPPDASALAAALRRMVEDGPLRAALGAANRAKAEAEYDEIRMFDTYARLIDG